MSKEKNLMEMIKASGLKKYYVTDNYEVHALDGVSLSVAVSYTHLTLPTKA